MLLTPDPDPDYKSRRFGLRTRLLVLVAIALLPIFAFLALQTIANIQESNVKRHDDLIEATHFLARDQATYIRSLRNLMDMIAVNPEVHDAGPQCNRYLSVLNETDRDSTHFAIAGLDGRIRCSGYPPEDAPDLAVADWFEDIVSGARFSIGDARFGAVDREAALVVAIPLHTDGEVAGIMFAGMPMRLRDALGLESQQPAGRIAGLVDRSGRVITQDENLNVGRIPEDRMAQAVQASVLVFERAQSDGSQQTIALAPLFGGDYFVLLAQPSIPLLLWKNIDVTMTVILPVIMWLLAIVVVWLAADFVILRWLEHLGRFARLYGRERYKLKPELTPTAPHEIRELSKSLSSMAARISARDVELQDTLDQKQILIREVHHRVKNNLQIIISLINLQLGRLKDGSAREALRQAQVRINALAIIHHNLYEAEKLTQIQIVPFIENIARLTHAASTYDGFDVRLEFDCDLGEQILTTDQAVPLAMFITEAMTNAYKHAFQPGQADQVISVKIQFFIGSDGAKEISVIIKDNGLGLDLSSTYKGMGSTLIDAFASQLDGEAGLQSDAGEGVTVSIRFPI